MVADTARLRKTEETTPGEWWKEGHKKGHIIINRYEMDPDKEREKTASQVGRPQGKCRHRHRDSAQEESNGGEMHTQNTNQNGMEHIS